MSKGRLRAVQIHAADQSGADGAAEGLQGGVFVFLLHTRPLSVMDGSPPPPSDTLPRLLLHRSVKASHAVSQEVTSSVQ